MGELAEACLRRNFRLLGLYSSGIRHLMTRDPVRSIEELRGKKIRVLMSDNRCSLHRASEWDETLHQRRLHRLILLDDARPA